MATKEQIWEAADVISAEGGTPTLAAVRAHMGGGSYTDISAAMKDWRTRQQASAAPIREPAPGLVAERLSEFGSELWALALELANNRLQSEREALEQARHEAEETREEAASLADSLAAELDQVRANLDVLSEQLAGSLHAQEQQKAVIEEFRTAALDNRHRAELAEIARDEIKTRADQLMGLLKEEQAAHAVTKTQQQAAIDHAKAEINATAQQLAQAKKETENARVAEQACQSRLEAAAREIDGLKTQLKEERSAARSSAEQAAELKGRLSVLEVKAEVTAEPVPIKKTSRASKKAAG